MPKNQDPNKDEKPKKKKRAKPGKGKRSKNKKVKVYYPVVIQNPDTGEAKEQMSEDEISYHDMLLCAKIERLAAKGLTNDEIIESIDISRFTFYQRIKNEPYFSYALFKHRDLAIHEVEAALHKRAVGFHYLEQQGTPTGMILEVKKYQPPETAAAKFVLTNRRPKEWKNKVQTTIEPGEGMGQITFTLKRREE